MPCLDIRIGTMIKGNAADPAAYVAPDPADSASKASSRSSGRRSATGQDLGSTRRALTRGDRRPRRHHLDARHVRQSARRPASSTAQTLHGWKALIDNAHLFGATCVAGFTGRVRGKPLTDSLPRFKEVWGELAKRAADKGVRIAFENCAMDGNWATGDWNIAHNPDAWELMFNEMPDDNLGLEWEPCHQMVYLIDPMPQIRKWAHKFFHVHGKDATDPLGRDPRARHLRQGAVRADAHARLRRQRLDRRHQRAAARRLDAARSTSKAGTTRSIATRSK